MMRILLLSTDLAFHEMLMVRLRWRSVRCDVDWTHWTDDQYKSYMYMYAFRYIADKASTLSLRNAISHGIKTGAARVLAPNCGDAWVHPVDVDVWMGVANPVSELFAKPSVVALDRLTLDKDQTYHVIEEVIDYTGPLLDRAFRFLAGLNLQDHSRADQIAQRDLVNELARALKPKGGAK